VWPLLCIGKFLPSATFNQVKLSGTSATAHLFTNGYISCFYAETLEKDVHGIWINKAIKT
jgi:hypothetical protein